MSFDPAWNSAIGRSASIISATGAARAAAASARPQTTMPGPVPSVCVSTFWRAGISYPEMLRGPPKATVRTPLPWHPAEYSPSADPKAHAAPSAQTATAAR